MVRVTMEKPNTIGVYFTKDFDSYPEDWIEYKCERLADQGYELTELKSSTSQGLIEATHDDQADVTLIKWYEVFNEVFDEEN